jgi:membrane protein required for colicin V production
VFYVSIKFYSEVATFLSEHIHSKLSPAYLAIIAFAILFILLMVLVYFISMKIEKVTEALHISLLNHLAGGIFGLAKWAFIVSVILALIDIFGNKLDFSFVKFNHSWLYTHLQMIAPTVMPGLLGKSA